MYVFLPRSVQLSPCANRVQSVCRTAQVTLGDTRSNNVRHITAANLHLLFHLLFPPTIHLGFWAAESCSDSSFDPQADSVMEDRAFVKAMSEFGRGRKRA